MENSHIFFLVGSCVVSFGIGRTLMHFRKKKRKDQATRENFLKAQALRDLPPQSPPRNKSKRKRQLQQRRETGEP